MTISGYTDIELFWRKIDIEGKDECWNIKSDRSRVCKPYEGKTYRCTVWKGRLCGYHRIALDDLTYQKLLEISYHNYMDINTIINRMIEYCINEKVYK